MDYLDSHCPWRHRHCQRPTCRNKTKNASTMMVDSFFVLFRHVGLWQRRGTLASGNAGPCADPCVAARWQRRGRRGRRDICPVSPVAGRFVRPVCQACATNWPNLFGHFKAQKVRPVCIKLAEPFLSFLGPKGSASLRQTGRTSGGHLARSVASMGRVFVEVLDYEQFV